MGWGEWLRYPFVLSFLLLSFLTIDAALRCRRFINALAALATYYSATTMACFRSQRGDLGEEYLSVEVLAGRHPAQDVHRLKDVAGVGRACRRHVVRLETAQVNAVGVAAGRDRPVRPAWRRGAVRYAASSSAGRGARRAGVAMRAFLAAACG